MADIRGTEGSNPSPSSGESLANQVGGFRAVLLHIGPIAGHGVQHISRHPPDPVWWRQDAAANGSLALGQDIDEGLAIARAIMQRLGYGPDKRLAVTMSTCNVEGYRDAAVIAISQRGEIYIDGQLELIETANWFPRVIRKDFTVGVTVAEGGLDEPDQKFYETYVCGADRNYTGYLQRGDRPAD